MIQMENPLNQFITVKLDDTNYFIWKDVAQTAIKSYDLEGFIQDEDGRRTDDESILYYA